MNFVELHIFPLILFPRDLKRAERILANLDKFRFLAKGGADKMAMQLALKISAAKAKPSEGNVVDEQRMGSLMDGELSEEEDNDEESVLVCPVGLPDDADWASDASVL